MWVKLSPKDWERVGSALRDARRMWEEFVAAGSETPGDHRKTEAYERTYQKFLTAPIKKRRKQK